MIQHKTVAIYISTINHYSLLNVLLGGLKPYHCKIHLFIPEGMEKYIPADASYTITHISNRKFTTPKLFRELDAADFLIVDQLYSLKELISFAFQPVKRPNLLIVHDCNSWFNPQTPLKFINKIKNRLTARVKSKFGHYAVAGENMLQYLHQELRVKQSIVIPFRYGDFDEANDSVTPYEAFNRLVVAVPGMISQRRRYEDLISQLTSASLKGKVELVLLGKPVGPYGEKIIDLVKQKNNEGFDIKYWTEFIPTETFDREIRRAHILFSEFDPVYQTDNGQSEIYGLSKETGISLLMLNKAKVGLLPAEFQQMKSIVGQTLSYTNLSDLPGILEDIHDGKIDLENYSRQALTSAREMNLKKVSSGLAEAYQSQIS